MPGLQRNIQVEEYKALKHLIKQNLVGLGAGGLTDRVAECERLFNLLNAESANLFSYLKSLSPE